MGQGERAREVFRERLRTITSNFIQEVSVCCDLAHPNIVRMLGYSAHPKSNGDGLLLVQVCAKLRSFRRRSETREILIVDDVTGILVRKSARRAAL